jgi:hypothetical protein
MPAELAVAAGQEAVTSRSAEPPPSRVAAEVVLVAHEIHDLGGMERAMAELIRRGSDRYRFTVVSRELAPDLREIARWERVRVPKRPFPAKYVLFFALGGLRLRRLRAPLVHTQFWSNRLSPWRIEWSESVGWTAIAKRIAWADTMTTATAFLTCGRSIAISVR